MDLGLTGKVALITGSSRGIGRGIAITLAEEGCDVMLTGRDEAVLQDAAAAVEERGGMAKYHPIDLREDGAPESLVEAVRARCGRLDILVNNAGTTKRGDFLTLTETDWREGYGLKFFAHVRLSRAAWPLLRESQGSIVTIGGTSGRIPVASFTIGSTVNAACAAFAKALADRGKTDKVQVNTIHPSYVETERLWGRIQSDMERTGKTEAEIREWHRRDIDVTRFGTPEDIAGLVAFIVSPRGRWLHGATIDMDGGEVPDRMTTNVLLTPARIGRVEIKNRIVMPPMTTRLADEEGFVTAALIDYYMARVRGGTGLVTVEMASPTRGGRHRRRELGIYDDRFVDGLTRLAGAIHAGGAKASIQLGHAGGHTRPDICGEPPVAPSAIAHQVFEITDATVIPREMTLDDIGSVISGFALAATRAERAGFDCVEIHAAHGYLISQFATPFENRRRDAYGGTLANRARFGLEVLGAVKAAVRIPVVYRLSVDDYFPDGLHFDEGRQIALWAAKAGADALHIAAGHYRSLPSAARMIPPMRSGEATFLPYAAEIRRHVDLPVIAVGRLGDPERAAAAVSSGEADFIALGRTLIAEPDWVAKLAAGEPARRCLACNTCVDDMRGGATIGCVVNAAAGREARFAAASPVRGARIAVIGAGPAGLTYASLVAKGNQVTVFERGAVPGGALRHAGRAPLFQEVAADQGSLDRYIERLVAACLHRGVTFRYRTDVVAGLDPLAAFDRIVIATGARYRFGLGNVAMRLLDLGAGNWPILRQLFSEPRLRAWFYDSARAPTGKDYRRIARPGQKVLVIGDAARPGKSRPAIASAFDAALLP